MRFADGAGRAVCAALLLAAVPLRGSAPADPPLVHVQRYAMGTMADLFAYHESGEVAAAAVEAAWAEIVRLDAVLSSFKPASDLSRVNRDGARGFVAVDSSLYDLVERSMALSALTGGRFDVTVGPLLRVWRAASESGRVPDPADVARARACVGSDGIELRPPDRIRLRSACVEIELGGVGKGYAVDRALAVMRAHGVTRALVNFGGSSIAAAGAPPGREGWPVRLGAAVGGCDVVLLRDAGMSTSEQRPRPFVEPDERADGILDPRSGAPVAAAAVTVVAPDATIAEALTKALLMTTRDEAARILSRVEGASAMWMGPDGAFAAVHNEPRLALAGPR